MEMVALNKDELFEVVSVMDVRIRTTKRYWEYIVLKHRELEDKLEEAFLVLKSADVVHNQADNRSIHLYYKRMNGHTIAWWLDI